MWTLSIRSRCIPAAGSSTSRGSRQRDRRRVKREDAAYAPDTVKDELWPWLRERGYAGAEDDQYLEDYLDGLGHRDAHLRPGIEVVRLWSWADAVELDDRGLLAAEIKDAVIEILTALQEPLPPACQEEVQPSS
jgi:hypothetical protein